MNNANNFIFLRKFNNYFNRKIKYFNSVADYPGDTDRVTYANLNFNPNDGVSTTIVVNWVDTENDNAYFEWSPDYLLVTNQEIVDGVLTDVIVSRWFVTEFVRTRGGQYQATLKRDVIADHLALIKEAPCFVEKGIIKDTTSPLVYNSEGFNANQIKKSETLLKDESGVPWLILYLKKGTLGKTLTGNINEVTVNAPLLDEQVYETLLTPIDQWDLYDLTETPKVCCDDFAFSTFVGCPWSLPLPPFTPYVGTFKITIKSNTATTSDVGAYATYKYFEVGAGQVYQQYVLRDALKQAYYNAVGGFAGFVSKARSGFNIGTLSDGQRIAKYNGKIIKDSNGKYWNIKVYTSTGTKSMYVTSDTALSLRTAMKSTVLSVDGITPGTNPDDGQTEVDLINYIQYRIEITENKSLECSCNTASLLTKTSSSIFDAICMPYPVDSKFYYDIAPDLEATKELSKACLDAIATALGGTAGFILDYQLVPYCPLQFAILTSGNKKTLQTNSNMELVFSADGDTVAKAWLVPEPNVSLTIAYEEAIEDDVKELKFANECKLYRFNSPNYDGSFDFNIVKNGGAINDITVDITFKPYQPYIHLCPNFGGLYGTSFGDARGLICGGEFSLGVINDQWINYQLNNKNYQAIFNRQIENLDVKHDIANANMYANALVGVGSATAGGAIAGGGAGALAAGGGALMSSVARLVTQPMSQAEEKSFAIDMYNFNLQNIQAKPSTVSRTDALTANNKFFPFLEVYEPTDVEKLAYMDKITYNGMTIGIIDKLSNWMPVEGEAFFKGQLIRLEEISDDTHMLQAIYDEINKGVFLTPFIGGNE